MTIACFRVRGVKRKYPYGVKVGIRKKTYLYVCRFASHIMFFLIRKQERGKTRLFSSV